ALRFHPQVPCLLLVLRNRLSRLPALPTKPDDLVNVEERQHERDQTEQGKHAAHRAVVIERPRREVGPQHGHAAFLSRNSMPTSGASTSSSSAEAPMRSCSPAAPRGSTGSTLTRSRSSRPRRMLSAPPGNRAEP